MAIRSSGRRRGLALASIAAVALSISLAIPGMTTTAGANPGNAFVAIDVAFVTPTFSLTGITTPTPATASIGADGSIDIPQAGIAFAPSVVHIGAPNPEIGDVTVQALANSDFVGVVDPATDTEWLAGRIEFDWTQPGTMTGCRIGPFDIVVTTNNPGSRPYSAKTGVATMVDNNFAVSAVDPNAGGCGEWQSSVNSALSLPIATTTTTTVVSTTSSPTTTTTPTPDTVLTDLVPDTPVPAFVMSTTMTPAPQAPTTPRTTPPTTAHPPTSAPTATTSPGHTPASTPDQIVPGPTSTPTASPGHQNTPRHSHHSRSTTNRNKKRHPGRHKKKTTKPKVRVVLPAMPGSATPGHAGPTNRAGFPLAGRNGRPPAAGGGTVIDAMLASSRHRAAPSSLNYLAILALLISAAYAAKLLRPDVEQVLRARRRPRRRLAGIDPPGK